MSVTHKYKKSSPAFMVESTIKHTPVQSTLGCNQGARTTNTEKLQTHRGGAPHLSTYYIWSVLSLIHE